MKIQIIALFTAFFTVLTMSNLNAKQPWFAPCLDFPSEWKVSEKAKKRTISYLSGLEKKKGIEKALSLVISRKKVLQKSFLEKHIPKIKIDGRDDDWSDIMPAAVDLKGNSNAATKKDPGARLDPKIDLVEVKAVLDKENLYIMFKTAASPDTSQHQFWLYIYNARKKYHRALYAYTNGKLYVNILKDGKHIRSKGIPADAYKIGSRDVVEIRVRRDEIHLERDTFLAYAQTYSKKTGERNFTNPFRVFSLKNSAVTTKLYLLAKYAEKIDLEKYGRLPLAQCITESFIYQHAYPQIYRKVIADGISMIREGEIFLNRFQKMPIEAILAWSGRLHIWGASGFYRDSSFFITRSAYVFMFLDPRILSSVRRHIRKEIGISEGKGIAAAADAVDDWAGSKNRYRWKPEVLRVWAKSDPGKKKLYHDTVKDIRAGRHRVTQVNGKTIYFYNIISYNHQWKAYKKNGYFYGSCGDISLMTQLGLKSLGIPDITFSWRFGKDDGSAHTFAGYFDPSGSVWKSPKKQRPSEKFAGRSASSLKLCLPPVSEKHQNFRKVNIGNGIYIRTSPRNPIIKMSQSEMKDKLSEGIENSVVSQFVFQK